MTTNQYFERARSLGAFTASDCLALARQAAEMDNAARLKNLPTPVVVWHETTPDGHTARFHRGITVY